MARLVRAATDRNPPTLGGGGCQNVGHSKGYTKGFEANPQRNETTMFVTANGNVLRFVPGTDAIVQVRLKDDCIRKITWAEKTDDGTEE